MLKQEKKWIKLHRMPALLITDKKGIIQYVYYGKNMHDIPENNEVLKILKKINKI
jgi:hypothetical protein